jgi:cysteine synthase A
MARIYNDITETIVAIVPSSSERYLSTWLFADIDTESDDIRSLTSV